MKRIFTWGMVILLSWGVTYGKNAIEPSYKMPSHPRLLLFKGEEKKLMKVIKHDSTMFAIHQGIMKRANAMLGRPNLERQLEGKRLLHICRAALQELFDLSYAYRITGKVQYLERAEKELLGLAEFQDWHPDHFLDVGEMTMGVAIAYDWLYSKLSKETRSIVEKAIIEKGLDPSVTGKYNKHWFIRGINNWSQVCHSGISYGALAVWESCPEKASLVVNRAIENLPKSMVVYGPDGGYPEGPGYWEYGTSFNVMFLSAMEKIFHSDFGLTDIPGFMKTGKYLTHMCSPGLQHYSYSDNGAHAYPSPTAFWFYSKTKDTNILYNQLEIMNKYGTGRLADSRLAPAALIWASQSNLSIASKPQSLYWIGEGLTPVCTMRSGWGNSDTFLGVKLGKASSNHSHMDIGSFVVEMDGVMWATDLGSENYNSLEQKKMDIWNMAQNSERWDVYRYNNFCHNTLTFNGQKQLVNEKVDFDPSSTPGYPGFVVADLTNVYKGQVKKTKRTFSLVDKEHVVIKDEIEALVDTCLKVTWNIVTPGKPLMVSYNAIQLEKEGKKIYLVFENTAETHVEFLPATPTRPFENKNKGYTLVRLHFTIVAGDKGNLKVTFAKDIN